MTGRDPTHGTLRRPDAHWRAALAFTLLGLAASLVMAALSEGVYHDDDLAHLQMARWASEYPRYLLHDWGRPGFTVPYALPAQLGWLPARVFSGLLTAATAWLAYAIAARQRIRAAALVPLLLWLQPLAFTLSYTTLTETPLMLYLALGMWLYLQRRFTWSAVVVSLCVLTRQDAGVFVAAWLAALLARRQPPRVWLWLGWAPLVHVILSVVFMPELPLVRYLRPQPTMEYGQGSWLTMLVRLAEASGVGVLLLAAGGAGLNWRRAGGPLWVGGAVLYFAAHTVIYRYGLFASGGYARFLVPIAPMLATMAAAALCCGWRTLRLGTRFGDVRRRVVRRAVGPALALVVLLAIGGLGEAQQHADALAGAGLGSMQRWVVAGSALVAAALVLGLIMAHGGRWLVRAGAMWLPAVGLVTAAATFVSLVTVVRLPAPMCRPLPLGQRPSALRTAARWVQARGVMADRVISTSPWFDELLGLTPPPFRAPAPQRVRRMRVGDWLLWDGRLASSPNLGLPASLVQNVPGLVERWRRAGADPMPYAVVLYEQMGTE